MSNEKPDMCKCPFCFKEFLPEAAHFKAMTVFTKQDLDDDESSGGAGDTIKHRYMEAKDEKYDSFWANFPGSKPDFEYEMNPVIANYDKRYLDGFYKKDADGFINEAVDDQQKSTKVRICPHCHNPLPFEFGKYPVKYIAVVGITSSGKTVYLAQLLGRFNALLARVDITPVGMHDEADAFTKNHHVSKGKYLPGGNSSDNLTLPIPINVVNNKTKEHYTLIFYDIAGENCVKPDKMEKYGPFIENADGIVMIVDPQQFNELFSLPEGSDDTYSPEKVIQAMYNAFVSAQSSRDSSKKPLAAALSKSDILRGVLQDNSNVFHNVDYKRYKNYGFLYEEWQDLNTELERILGNRETVQGKLFMNQINICFPDHGYFAVSALNCTPVQENDLNGVKHYKLDEDPEPLRIEEPLFWLLYRLGMIDGISRDDKVISGGGNGRNKKKMPEKEKKKGGGFFSRGRR